MTFFRQFPSIFFILALGTVEARWSTRPDDYDDKVDLDFNSKVLLEAVKDLIMNQNNLLINQIRTMEEKCDNLYKNLKEENKLWKNWIKSQLNKKVPFNQNATDGNLFPNLGNQIQELLQNISSLEKYLTVNEEETEDEELDQDGTSNIWDASRTGSLQGVKYWHAKNPSYINQVNRHNNNYTALHFASIEGNIDIVNFLLSRGAVVDAEDSTQTTPLMIASWNGWVSVVKSLLINGADVNKKGGVYKWTPLRYAVNEKHFDVVRLLIGADATQ